MFALFMFSGYYPLGGTNDMKGVFDSIEEALEVARINKDYHDYYEIINNRFETVEHNGTSYL